MEDFSKLSICEELLMKSCCVIDMKNESTSMEYFDTERDQRNSIYCVPAFIKDLHPNAYHPQVISFGPFHHGRPKLAPMEVHKRRSLQHFLQQCAGNKNLEDFVVIFEDVVEPLLAAYQGLDEKWKNNRQKFIEMMILDGCFMLEFMRFVLDEDDVHDYASNDPVFSRGGRVNLEFCIKCDMLMIENQLPLLVLRKLIDIEAVEPPKDDTYINDLVRDFFDKSPLPPNKTLGLHLLDVYRTCLVQGTTSESLTCQVQDTTSESLTSPVQDTTSESLICPVQDTTSEPRDSEDTDWNGEDYRSATELHEAGIKFKKSETKSIHDINFQNGKLTLPRLVVEDMTKYVFLNLMAFERLHMVAGNDVISYVCFMDLIINQPRDVSLLKSEGIILNLIGSDKAVAELFNSLGRNVIDFPDSHLWKVYGSVYQYSSKKWNSWRASLIDKYFQNPWTVISLIAAIFLLFLTVVQTFCSIYSTYNK